MAVRDLQAFIQERARNFDENLDLSPGSPFDNEVIQPILRRLGTDPFTVDLAVFLDTRLKQAFPELATNEGDALTDLLVKTVTLLWDPVVREIFRIRNSQSFKDPSVLTLEEAEALGANLFSEVNRGDRSRGTGRLFFSQPRDLRIGPVNFFTSKSGLHFVPDGSQTITLEEMLLNVVGSLYYFDVSLVAENPGTQYNIGPDELVTVANIDSAVRVTNIRRFQGGQPADTAVDFIDRSRQDLTERSLVTLRGIGAQLTREFSEISRLGVVGFNDPEMKRDVITGGSLGPILAGGTAAAGELDGENQVFTRRVRIAAPETVDFTALIGPTSIIPSGFVVTLIDMFGTNPPRVRDLPVTRVISTDVIEVGEQVINTFSTNRPWMLRKKELTLSGIPGGILFPNTPQGDLVVPEDKVHIGGVYDVHVRGLNLDEDSLVLENLTDENPVARGTLLHVFNTNEVTLDDFVLGTNYAVNDDLYKDFESAKTGHTLQILDGPNAGSYRIIGVTQSTGAAPVLELDQTLSILPDPFRWKLVDVIDVDLIDPKETRIQGADLITVQHIDEVETASSTDFTALGISVDDTLRILNGPDAGDFTVKGLVAFNRLRLDRPLKSSTSNVGYIIFRPNSQGGIELPLVRISSVELLDSSGQPVGSKIPYANPVDVQSRAFQNPGRGVKVSVRDGRLGIVSKADPGGGFNLGGLNLVIQFPNDTIPSVSVTFSGTISAQDAVDEINAQAVSTIGPNTRLATVVDGDRIGILPIGKLVIISGGNARTELFGNTTLRTSADIRSETVNTTFINWSSISPAINEDNLDVAMVLDGFQIGFYGKLHTSLDNFNYNGLFSGDFDGSNFSNNANFAPEVGRHIQVGARSIGSARCFFLDPTTIEFGQDSVFTTTLESGATIRFFPDPTVDSVRIPPPPEDDLPKNGQTGGVNFVDTTQDFIRAGIRPGDILDIKYVPIVGGVLPDPVLGLALTTFILSIDGRADQKITFVNDLSGFPSDVSRTGVIDQINSAVGMSIAQLSGSDEIEIEANVSVVIRKEGTANAILGFSTGSDSKNDASNSGRFVVNDVGVNNLNIGPGSLSAQSRISYRVIRSGVQRISSTEMNGNVGTAGLYFFDVELVSEGTGDLWNIPSMVSLFPEGYVSDGYFLSNEDENLSFSLAEKPKLHVSRSILEIGASDSPENATLITGQNIQVNYERSVLTADVQNFLSSETERVVCSSPLSRFLIPHFVRFDLSYAGGSRTDVVTQDLENYINGRFPSDLLESSDIQDVAYRRGATSVTNPIDLVAVVHKPDRSIFAQRSQNALNTGRLAAFIPDVLNVTRRPL